MVEESIQFFVNYDNQTRVHYIRNNMTIKDIDQFISDEIQVPIENFYLIFNGKCGYEKNKMIRDVGITNDTTIYVLIKLNNSYEKNSANYAEYNNYRQNV